MATTAPVTHIVLFKYRATTPWQTLESHFRDFAALKQTCLNASGKPYMLSLRMGRNTSWENFNKNMTHAFVLDFKDEADRDYYLLHDKVHREFSAKAVEAGLIEDSVVVDLKDGELFGKPVQGVDGTARKAMRGGCHCGAIRFEVVLDEYRHVICHCRTCQVLGGGPYSCNAVVVKDALRVIEGQPAVYSYTGASGKPVLCFHCSTCTSHIYHRQMSNPDKVIVRTLLLDDGDKMGLGGEIFAEGALGWARDLKACLPS